VPFDYFKQYEALKDRSLTQTNQAMALLSRARLELEQKNQQIIELNCPLLTYNIVAISCILSPCRSAIIIFYS